MKRPTLFFSSLLAVCLFAAAVEAADWPGFRGPLSNGFTPESDLPIKWTKDNFLWKAKMPGPSSASPIVVNDKVIVLAYSGYGTTLTKGNPLGGDKGKDKGKGGGAGNDQKELKRFVMCFDGKSGQMLWQQEVEPKLPEQSFTQMIREHGYASNTPVTDGERVCVFFGKTGVLAFDMTGKKLWQTDVGTGLYVYGSASSLAMHKDLVFVNASAESKALIALNKTTGKVVWRNKDITPTWSSPAVVKTQDGKFELVLSQPKKVAGFDPETGKQLWQCKGLPVPDGGSSYCTPVAQDGIIYLSGGGGPGPGAMTMAVRTGGQGDVTKSHVLWSVKGGPTINSPVVLGEYLYVVDGSATCLDVKTGKSIYSKQRVSSGTGEYSSPVLAGDKIFSMTKTDGLYVVATGAKFQALAHNSFQGDNSAFNASPAISNGRIYVRSQDYLYCIGKKAGP